MAVPVLAVPAVTDLGEIVRARLAEKAQAGKRPTQADLMWLEATGEPAPSSSHVELTRNAKGETQISVKVYDRDPLAAEAVCTEMFTRLRATYPMLDGTAGAPMVDQP